MSKFIQHDPEGFSEWWAVWRPIARHTDGKGLAREAYRKQLLRGATPEDLIDGATWYARNLSDREKPYVPLSSTWIHRETFDGLCDKERAYQQHLSSQAQENVVQIRPVQTVLPANHFSRMYEPKKQEQA